MNNFLFTFLAYRFGVSLCWPKNFESNIMLRPALPHQIRSSNIYKHSTAFSQLRTERDSWGGDGLFLGFRCMQRWAQSRSPAPHPREHLTALQSRPH